MSFPTEPINQIIADFRLLEEQQKENTFPLTSFYGYLLKLTQKWQLQAATHPEVHLVDPKQKIAVKIHFESSISLINSGIDQFVKSKLYQQYDSLYVILPGERQNYGFISFSNRTKRKFDFDKDKHIITHEDLLSIIKNGKADLQEELCILFDNSLSKAAPVDVATEEPSSVGSSKKSTSSVTANALAAIAKRRASAPPFAIQYQLSKACTDLLPMDLLGLRSIRNFGAYFHTSTYYNTLSQLIGKQPFILVTGRSLSGKTRSILQALQKLENTILLVPSILHLREKMPLPPAKKGQQLIVLLDQLSDYFRWYNHKYQLINKMIHFYLQKGIPVIATCTSGHERQTVADFIDPVLLNKCMELYTPDISYDDILEFQAEVDQRLNFDSFDETIGSLFLDIPLAKKQFEQWKSVDASNDEIAASQVMESLQCMHFAGCCHGFPMVFSQEKARDFTQRLLARKISLSKWNAALDLLKKLDWIRFDEETITTDAAYLKQVVLPDYTPHKTRQEIYRVFDKPATQTANDFFSKTFDIALSIHQARNYQDADEIFFGLSERKIKIHTAVCNALLRKTETFEQATVVFKWMQKKKVAGNLLSYNTLLSRSDTYRMGREVWKEMLSHKVVPNTYSYTLLLHLTETEEDAHETLSKMSPSGLAPTIQHYNITFQKTKTFKKGLVLLEQLQAQELAPSAEIFAQLIYLAQDKEDAFLLLDAMQKAGLPLDADIYFHLTRKANNFKEGMLFLQRMKQEEIAPNEMVVAAIAQHVSDFMEASELLETSSIPISQEMMEHLILQMKDYDQAKPLFYKITRLQLTFSLPIINHLLSLAPDYAASQPILDKMKQLEIVGDQETYAYLLPKVTDYEAALALLEEMKVAEIQPNSAAFQSLFALAPTYEAVIFHLQAYKAIPLPLDDSMLGIITKALANQEQVFIDTMLQDANIDLSDMDYHRIFVELLPQITQEPFFTQLEETIYKADSLILLYTKKLIQLGKYREASRILEEMDQKSEDYYLLKDEMPFNF